MQIITLLVNLVTKYKYAQLCVVERDALLQSRLPCQLHICAGASTRIEIGFNDFIE